MNPCVTLKGSATSRYTCLPLILTHVPSKNIHYNRLPLTTKLVKAKMDGQKELSFSINKITAQKDFGAVASKPPTFSQNMPPDSC